MDAALIWNTILTVLIGAVGYFMSTKFRELDRISILLNRTREEVARDHITRAELNTEMQKILDRFDRLEYKIDRMMESRNG